MRCTEPFGSFGHKTALSEFPKLAMGTEQSGDVDRTKTAIEYVVRRRSRIALRVADRRKEFVDVADGTFAVSVDAPGEPLSGKRDSTDAGCSPGAVATVCYGQPSRPNPRIERNLSWYAD